MPMRKASIDMAIPCQPQSTNLRQPMRKASVDMNFNVTSKLESWSQTFHDEGAPPTGRLSRPGCYRYMNNEGTEEGHSSSESSRDGDGCMIDLIRPKSITREVVRDIEEKIQMQNAEGSYEEEIGENSDNGGCMLDQDVRSMPRRSKWNQHEGELKQQDYGYQEHHPTPRLYDDCCYQTEVLCDAEGNESIASDCMINMVRSRAQHLQLVVTATGRPQRKASIDMCGNGSSMIDVIGLQAGQGSNWNRTPDRRTSLAMISVEEAKRHIANGTAREVQ